MTSIDNTMFTDKPNYYDLLEIHPDASPQEIREAYLKLKSAYSKNSVALYSLFDREQTESILEQIENAYEILSNPEKRKKYDLNHGGFRDAQPWETRSSRSQPKGSKSRPAALAAPSGDEDLLVPPVTDFTRDQPEIVKRSYAPPQEFREPNGKWHPTDDKKKEHIENTFVRTASVPESNTFSNTDTEVQSWIEAETEWGGPFLKKIRENRRISIEEMADFTKISKTYLKSIEEENYPALPAPVFLRGFLIQIARKLRLPQEKVAAAYMTRYRQVRTEK